MADQRAVNLTRELAQVPITAVAFDRDPATGALHVLAGEDTDLVVYRVGSAGRDAPDEPLDRRQTPVARVVRVLAAQPIHGIHVHRGEKPAASSTAAAGEDRVLLWGGSSVAVLELSAVIAASSAGKTQPLVARLRAPDWIYDGAVCPADADLVVLVTAHNEVVTARMCNGEKGGVLALALASPLVSPSSRPMLYAASVCWTAPDEVLVAAGTVFGDVLVWKHALGGGGTPRMLYSLSGHEGSIFGVRVSPRIEMPDGGVAVRLLASCSDDRTIRIWNITEYDEEEEEEEEEDGDNTDAGHGALATEQAADTGFRCAPAAYGGDGDGDGGRADVAPIATAMGHASRIWDVWFGLPGDPATLLTNAERQRWSEGEGLLSVYSFGEDATAQKWSLDVAAALRDPQQPLVHDKTYALHDGKHLWSRAVYCNVEEGGAPTTRILTGGADSKITLVKETVAKNDDDDDVYNYAETWETRDIRAAIGGQEQLPPTTTAKQRKEVIGRYDFLTPDVLLAVGNMGTLLLGTFCGKGATTWEELAVDDEATRADMQNVYAIRRVSYGGALLGSVTGGIYYFGLRDRRVVPVARLAGRVVEVNALSDTERGAAGDDVEAVVHLHRDAASVHLVLDRDTGAVKSQAAIDGLDSRFVAVCAARIDDNLLAIGSRHGWIALLRRSAGNDGAWRPVFNLPPASGDAVTAIVPLPPSPSADSRAKYVLATSRDGKYRIFQLHLDGVAAAQMTLLHETAPPFGPWIEGAWFTGDAAAPELILYGFRSKDFVVWNETRREELATMDCGGAHRTFRLARDEHAPACAAGRVRLAFTRTSRLAVHSQRGRFHEVVRLGQHGREIRSLAAAGHYVATGAEDTTIRLWEFDSSSSRMQHRAYMKRHVTGLQKVLWRGDEYLFSSGGNEELFAWRVRTLDSAYAGRLAVVCEGVFADKSPMKDLRIMDFDVAPDGDVDSTVVTIALSNSALKTYRYTAAGGFALVCTGMYTGACLTQARHLETQNGDLHVVTASTDGHVALWQGCGGRYELAQTLQVHQSSVKSLDLTRRGGGGGYGVVTGGDDNALAWTLLKREADDTARPLRFRAELGAVVRRAHAAAVTGVAITEHEGEVRCVSVSNDQWVKTWGIREGMRLLGEVYSGVADAGDVAVLERERGGGGRVVVAGVGLEVWRRDGRG
ncbi:WD domain containing protein [Beauveria brongniartii RCEF 3172]|uniref:WD domain containing protein n=1 Tax=Beauveria brongniartii RCEF 3172 TaxID=1081107 RepID=A0A167EY34_9HYPO|nr:WD domain containing protein [Beauveria brongniartii RCEF 3172]